MWIKQLTALFLVLLSSNIYASDYSGFFASMYLMIVVSISTAINLGLIVSFYASGKYQELGFVKKHIGTAIIIPLIGILLALADHRTSQDLIYCLGLNTFAGVLAFIPLFLRQAYVQTEHEADDNQVMTKMSEDEVAGNKPSSGSGTDSGSGSEYVASKSQANLGPKMLVVASVLAVCSVLLFPPLAFAAIFSGHVAMNNNQGQKQTLSMVVLALSYVFAGIWLITIVKAFS